MEIEKEDHFRLRLVSFAAVFRDVTQRSPAFRGALSARHDPIVHCYFQQNSEKEVWTPHVQQRLLLKT